jgi:hypothetical protein
MAEREEESDAEGSLSFLQHDAHGVINCCDVIGIEGMAQSQHVGHEAKADQRGVMSCEMQIQSPADNVQHCYNAIETAELDAILRREANALSAYRARLRNIEQI